MRIFLHSLVILAMVMSVISPACAFISGNQNLIEICAADGTVKTIAVSDDFAHADDVPSQDEDSSGHEMQKDCAFCFAQTHISHMFVSSDILLLNPAKSFQYNNKNSVFYSKHHGVYLSRAPPHSFV